MAANNIILVGFMGAGKDTVGLKLSACTGLRFLSTDDYIALEQGKTVSQIIKAGGERRFRRLEHQTLLRLKHLKNIVLATGGGIVLDSANRAILKTMGTVVHLDVSAAAASRRLKSDHGRPLLTDRRSLFSIHRHRQGLYDFADLHIPTDRQPPGAIARCIAERLCTRAGHQDLRPQTVMINTPSRTYPVFIGTSSGRDRPTLLAPIAARARRGVIVTNPLAGALFARGVTSQLSRLGIRAALAVIPDGEVHKSAKTALGLIDSFMAAKLDRTDLVVTLGGGVVADIGGLAASIYKRGVPLVHIPTTLLAQVDAAIGGKTGVNLIGGKNMLGTFYQPRAVFCDPAMTMTLSDREYANGMAEVIKYAVIADAGLFRQLEADSMSIQARDLSLLQPVIKRCIEIKKTVVEADEREEKGAREILNFGHTVGHALETLTGHRTYEHGTAVALGMAAEVRAAWKSAALDRHEFQRIVGLLKLYGLPVTAPALRRRTDIIAILSRDKKAQNGKIRMPVPVRIGQAIIKEVACRELL